MDTQQQKIMRSHLTTAAKVRPQHRIEAIHILPGQIKTGYWDVQILFARFSRFWRIY